MASATDLAQGRHPQHPAAVGQNRSALAGRAGVKDGDILHAPGGIQAGDRQPLAVFAGVAARGHDDAHRGARIDVERALVEPAVDDGLHDRDDVAPDPHEQRLGLGVAEAAVELEHLDLIAVDHEPGIEHPLYGRPSAAMAFTMGSMTSCMIFLWISRSTTGAGE